MTVPSDEVDDLIFRFLRGEASETELAALRKHVEKNPQLANRIFAAAETDHDLANLARLSKAASESRTGPSGRVKLSVRAKRSAGRQTSMFWPALAAAGILIAVALFVFNSKRTGNVDVAQVEKPEGQVVARVEEIKGEVRVLSANNSESPATKDFPLREAQGVRTGKGSQAVVVFSDGTRLSISANSRIPAFSAETASRGKSLQLISGSLQATVSKQTPDHPFIIRTPNAEAEVLGTVLNVSADVNLTRVAVLEGSVRLTRNDKASAVITAGRSATAIAGRELRSTLMTPLDAEGSITFNFGPAGASLPPNVLNDSGEVFSADRGFGWDGPKEGPLIPGATFTDHLGVVHQIKKGREATQTNKNPGDLRDSMVTAGWANSTEVWRLPCESGKYLVTVCVGEFYNEQGPHHVRIEDQQIINAEMTGPNKWLERENIPVEVKDGEFTMTVGGHGSKKTASDASSDTSLCYIKIKRIATEP